MKKLYFTRIDFTFILNYILSIINFPDFAFSDTIIDHERKLLTIGSITRNIISEKPTND